MIESRSEAAGRRLPEPRRALAAAGLAVPLAFLIALMTGEGFPAGLAGLGLGLALAAALLVRRLNAADLAAARAEEEARHLAARLAAAEASADQALSRAERHESHFAAQPDPVVRRDAAGCITFANAAFAALMGEAPDMLAGRPAYPPLREGQAAPLPGTVAEDAYDQLLDTPDGPRWIAWRDAVVTDGEGLVLEIQSVGRDVSARKTDALSLAAAQEAAEAANAAKSRFLAGMSHEIRTPLSGILGMAGLLQETALSPEQRTYARAIEASGGSLLGLIDELLDLSKIEAGGGTLMPGRVAPAALIEAVTELLGPRAQEKGLEIASYIAPDVPLEIEADGERLRQILLNLIGNAVKFTQAGGVAVTLGRRTDKAGDRLVFVVRDTGIGIAKGDLERIFAPFEQAGEGPRAEGGTGLGLAIARRLATLMGGMLAVESQPGRGASFTLDMPLDSAAPAPVPVRPLAGSAVLLASPSTVSGPLLGRLLADLGAEIRRVQSLAEAALCLAEARRTARPFAACLVDIGFGVETAGGFARAATRDAAERRIVLMAPAERCHIDALRRDGFDSYLIKPVRNVSLLACVTGHDAWRAAEPPPVAPAPAGVRSLRLLVAEDDEVNALLLMKLVSSLGHRGLLVRSGAAALRQIREAATRGETFDAVLMDVHMPDMDGHEATRRIRNLPPGGGGALPALTPILAVTADAAEGGRREALDAGMDLHLTKPVEGPRLAEALTAICMRAPAARAAGG